MRRRAARFEAQYLRFIKSTRTGLTILAGAVALLIFLISFGLENFAIAYTATLFVPLAATALWRRRRFSIILLGGLDCRRVIFLGIVPLGIFLILQCSLIYELHASFHEPITRYVAPVLEGIPASQNWSIFEIPFVEEMIFRLWLQTRLQQYLGILGAVLSAVVFLGLHLTLSPWRIVGAIILTWLRYRYRALGACILAHYTYDVGLWAFVTFVH